MTLAEKREYKQAAQEAMKENGKKVFQKDIILLEAGSHYESVFGTRIKIVDYVMSEDVKSGKQYQCYYGAKHYNPETESLWEVEEYIK